MLDIEISIVRELGILCIAIWDLGIIIMERTQKKKKTQKPHHHITTHMAVTVSELSLKTDAPRTLFSYVQNVPLCCMPLL